MSEHPQTPQLLAWLDGELNPLQSWRMQRHVRRCWPCRSKVTSLEEAICVAGKTLTEPPESRPGDIGRAKWRFREAAAAFEMAGTPAAKISSPSGLRPTRQICLSTAAAAAALLFTFWLSTRPHPALAPRTTSLSAQEQLSRIIRAEVPQSTAGVREETFNISLQVAGKPAMHRNWQHWSAPRLDLYASRWQDAEGRLRNAVYASRRSGSSLYSAEHGLQPVSLRPEARDTLLSPARLDADRDLQLMESYVLGWIQRQVWEPVSLAREVAEFCSLNGSSLRVSRPDGNLRWEAEAHSQGRTIQVILEAPEGGAPRLLEVRWRSPRGVSTLHVDRVQTRDGIAASVAEPYLHPVIGSSRLITPELHPADPTKPSVARIAAAELQVVLALHQARLCRTDAIQINAGDDGVRVAALFLSAAQRGQLSSIVKEVPDAELIQLQFDVPLNRPNSPPLPDSRSAVPAAGADHRAAGEAWLRKHLDVGGRTSEREMFDLMNVLVREAEEMSAASWALRSLAERFPVSREMLLDGVSRTQLHRLAAEHSADLARSVATASALLTSLEVRLPEDAAKTPVRTGSWQERVHELLPLTRTSSDLLLRFFAGGSPATDADTDPSHSQLPAALADLRRKLAAAEEPPDSEPSALVPQPTDSQHSCGAANPGCEPDFYPAQPTRSRPLRSATPHLPALPDPPLATTGSI